jgi:type III secretion protein R
MKRPFFFFCLALLLSYSLFAQDLPNAAESVVQTAEGSTPNLTVMLAILAGVALIPFAVMMLTSYVKMAIVLSLLRNALGVQQSPPNQVINGIALLLTIYVMYPTGLAMYKAAEQEINAPVTAQLLSGPSATYFINVASKAKEPLRQFLQRNSLPKHVNSFYQLALRSFPQEVRSSLKAADFIVLIPAFVTSQLKAAFEIGVLIYLPFFVIDLVTSNILLAMGMMMLSPLTIALPLKLLLLVMVDGWTLILQGLVLSFR